MFSNSVKDVRKRMFPKLLVRLSMNICSFGAIAYLSVGMPLLFSQEQAGLVLNQSKARPVFVKGIKD